MSWMGYSTRPALCAWICRNSTSPRVSCALKGRGNSKVARGFGSEDLRV